jgi:hypothetical protein
MSSTLALYLGALRFKSWLSSLMFYVTFDGPSRQVLRKYLELSHNHFLSSLIIQGTTIECDDFRTVFWWIGLNTQNTKTYRVSAVKCRSLITFYILIITPLNWCSWHVTHSCNHDWKLTIIAHNLPPAFEYVSYGLVLNVIMLREEVMSGSKLQPMINICHKLMVNF